MRILLCLLLCWPLMSQAQYITAGGVCIGNNMGLTLQQRVWKKVTVESVFETNLRGDSRFSATLQRHYNIIFKGFNYYFGAGIHRGWEQVAYLNDDIDHAWGASGIVGMELMLGRSLLFSFHYRPGINITGGQQISYHQSGLSIRQVFVKDKRNKLFGGKKKRRNKRKKDGGIFSIFDKE